MDVAAMSAQLSAAQFQTNAGLAVANKVMDATKVQAAGLLDMMQQSAPSFGHALDVRV